MIVFTLDIGRRSSFIFAVEDCAVIVRADFLTENWSTKLNETAMKRAGTRQTRASRGFASSEPVFFAPYVQGALLLQLTTEKKKISKHWNVCDWTYKKRNEGNYCVQYWDVKDHYYVHFNLYLCVFFFLVLPRKVVNSYARNLSVKFNLQMGIEKCKLYLYILYTVLLFNYSAWQIDFGIESSSGRSQHENISFYGKVIFYAKAGEIQYLVGEGWIVGIAFN